MRLFKKGDLVKVRDCDELQMPCTVEGPDEWMPQVEKEGGGAMYLYRIIGTHAKRGNKVSVRVAESQLTLMSE